jgi:hypothetical protein
LGGAKGLEAELPFQKAKSAPMGRNFGARRAGAAFHGVAHLERSRLCLNRCSPPDLQPALSSQPGRSLAHDTCGLPLPPGYTPADPTGLVNDIADPQNWRAYCGASSIGSLQAFFSTRSAAQRMEDRFL